MPPPRVSARIVAVCGLVAKAASWVLITSLDVTTMGSKGFKSFIAVVLVLSLLPGQLQIQVEDDAKALEFCKLGCASSSSLCDNNIKQAVGNKEASDAVNRCDEACYRFCTKHLRTCSFSYTTIVTCDSHIENMEARTAIKSFITVVLVLGLVLGHQIQVEAKSCCPSMYARNVYNACRVRGNPQSVCAKMSGCKIVQGKCDDPYYNSLHSDSGEIHLYSFFSLDLIL
nr:unnamed protein product [Digitaria exilis]